MNPIRILIADDHTLFRRGLISLLGETRDFEIVGEASSGPEAAQIARATRPDVVLMDIHMPGGSGTDAVAELRATMPALPVIILTVSESDADLVRAIQAGARGYFLKNAETELLVNAIRQVAAGQAVLDPTATEKILRYIAQPSSASANVDTPLSARETEILDLVASGFTNREIAAKLFLSENTIKTHVARILEKLGATSRSQAATLARMRGWLSARNAE
ncbi:MAG: response regulator transcription factor [Chloroflexi bacterium]|nr:response regulator transcription factor [Chloroflexota bacterium]